MKSPSLPLRSPRRALLALAAVMTSAAAFPALASGASVSANWAGYVALGPTSGKSFKSISGSWTEPSVTCKAGEQSFSAVWVGLGGYHENSRALEQIGTEADCSSGGEPDYSTWYELLPAGPVTLKIDTRPGDAMGASVTVRGHDVTLRLRDATTGGYVSVTRRISAVDTSSAEWIVEAPSSCFSEAACRPLPLSDFGTEAFASASATLGAHTAAPASPYWSDVELELRQGSGVAGLRSQRYAPGRPIASLIAATPSPVTTPRGAFTVSWEEQPFPSEEPTPPQPDGGFGG